MRGRVGIAEGPWLLYGTGGRDSGIDTGYAVGGGLEWAFARNCSAKAEYLLLGFGDDTLKDSGGSKTVRVNNDVQTVRSGLNYKF